MTHGALWITPGSPDKVVDVVTQAMHASSRPAFLGRRWRNFVMNQHKFTPDGVILGVNPRGLADRGVPVLRIDAPAAAAAVLFGELTIRRWGHRSTRSAAIPGFPKPSCRRNTRASKHCSCSAARESNPYPPAQWRCPRPWGRAGQRGLPVLETKLRPVRGPVKIAFDEAADLPLQPPPSRRTWKSWRRADAAHHAIAKQILTLLNRGDKSQRTTTVLLHSHRWRSCDAGGPAGRGRRQLYTAWKSIRPTRLWVAGYCDDLLGCLPVGTRSVQEGGYETRRSPWRHWSL